MPTKHHPHHKELVRTRRRFTILNLFLVAALAVAVGYVARNIFANTDNGNPFTCSSYPTLQSGSTGDCVKYLQWDLNLPGYNNNLTEDGIFGSATKQAVINYQNAHGLSADGVVGSQTWGSINRETAKVYITSFCVDGNCTYGGTPANATTNQVMTFSWNTSSTTDRCTVKNPTTNWSGDKPTSGSEQHHASNIAGTYTFDLYCSNDIWHFETTRQVKVSAPAPPPVPTVSLSSSASSVQVGQKVTITWSSTNASSCTLAFTSNGTTDNFNEPTSGSSTGTFSTTGTKTYKMTCTNSSGSASKSVSVNVTASPLPHGCGSGTDNSTCPPPHGCGPGTDNSTCTTGGGNNGGGNNGGGRNSGGSHINDTTAPSAPGNFKAVLGADKSIVMLSWSPSTDTGGSGLKGYQVERSPDQSKWTVLSSSITTTTFTDASTAYKTAYFYRIKAIDNAGNSSGYAKTNITTGEFKATAEGTLISSSDGIVRATLPLGSLDTAASCTIVNNSDNNKSLSGLKPLLLMYGPYELSCKTQDGNEVSLFKKAVNVGVYPEAKKVKNYKTVSIAKYNSNGDNWSHVDARTNQLDNKDKNKISLTFTVNSPLILAVMGLPKPGLPWGWISFILLIILAGVAVFILYLRRAQRENYQDYLRRKYYNL